MKKIYVKPSMEIIEGQGERIMNSGSVVTGAGVNAGKLGDGGSGGTKDSGGTIWGDAKGNNLWDDDDDDEEDE